MKQNFSQSVGFIIFVVVLFIVVTVMLGDKVATFFAGLVLLSMLILNGGTLGAKLTQFNNMTTGNKIDIGRTKAKTGVSLV